MCGGFVGGTWVGRGSFGRLVVVAAGGDKVSVGEGEIVAVTLDKVRPSESVSVEVTVGPAVGVLALPAKLNESETSNSNTFISIGNILPEDMENPTCPSG